MGPALFPLVAGSNEDLIVQLYDAANDTGSTGIDLTGGTAFSANAKNPATGTTVSFATAAIYGAATDGKVKLTYATNAFVETGTFDLQITYTDGAGKTRKYPSEGNQLKIKVTGAN
jgi:hypothetical protein